MISIKIFNDRPSIECISLIDLSTKNVGIETALYSSLNSYQFEDEVVSKLKNIPSNFKIHHTNHGVLGLYELAIGDPIAIKKLDDEAEACAKMGISKVIVHLSTIKRDNLISLNPLTVLDLITNSLQLFKNRGIIPLLENTFESVEWHNSFWQEVIARKMQSEIGMTLDIGHVRVWGGGSLDSFTSIIDSLCEAGFKTHFHLHLNDGARDLHAPLYSVEFEESLTNTTYCKKGLIPWINDRLKLHKDSLLTLESDSELALNSLSFISWELENLKE